MSVLFLSFFRPFVFGWLYLRMFVLLALAPTLALLALAFWTLRCVTINGTVVVAGAREDE